MVVINEEDFLFCKYKNDFQQCDSPLYLVLIKVDNLKYSHIRIIGIQLTILTICCAIDANYVSWSHGHSSYYVLHFHKLIFRNKSEEFPRRHFTFSFGKMRIQLFCRAGRERLDPKISRFITTIKRNPPHLHHLYHHNQEKSASTTQVYSIGQ